MNEVCYAIGGVNYYVIDNLPPPKGATFWMWWDVAENFKPNVAVSTEVWNNDKETIIKRAVEQERLRSTRV